MKRLLILAAAIGVGVVCRDQLVKVLTRTTGTWVGSQR